MRKRVIKDNINNIFYFLENGEEKKIETVNPKLKIGKNKAHNLVMKEYSFFSNKSIIC